MNKKHEKRSIAKWFAPLIVKLLQCLEVSFRGDHPLLVVSTRLSQAYSLVCTDVCPKTKEWETTKINKYKNAHPNCTLHAHICVCTNCLYVYIYSYIYINVQYYTHIEETNVIIDIWTHQPQSGGWTSPASTRTQMFGRFSRVSSSFVRRCTHNTPLFNLHDHFIGHKCKKRQPQNEYK
jgi:hypothetical protein